MENNIGVGQSLEQRIDNLVEKYNVKFLYNYKYGTNSNRVHFYFYTADNIKKVKKINNPRIAINKKPVFFYFKDFKREISDKEFQKRFFEALDKYIHYGKIK